MNKLFRDERGEALDLGADVEHGRKKTRERLTMLVDHWKFSDRNQTEIRSFSKWMVLSKMSTEESSLAEDFPQV